MPGEVFACRLGQVERGCVTSQHFGRVELSPLFQQNGNASIERSLRDADSARSVPRESVLCLQIPLLKSADKSAHSENCRGRIWTAVTGHRFPATPQCPG